MCIFGRAAVAGLVGESLRFSSVCQHAMMIIICIASSPGVVAGAVEQLEEKWCGCLAVDFGWGRGGRHCESVERSLGAFAVRLG